MTDPECGGCRGVGAHRRWCAAVVGHYAANRGRQAERARAIGDGCNVPEAANHLWRAASILETSARQLAERWQAEHDAPARDEPIRKRSD